MLKHAVGIGWCGVGSQATMMLRYEIFSYTFTHPWCYSTTWGDGVGCAAGKKIKVPDVKKKTQDQNPKKSQPQIALPLLDFSTKNNGPILQTKMHIGFSIKFWLWAKSPGLSNTLALAEAARLIIGGHVYTYIYIYIYQYLSISESISRYLDIHIFMYLYLHIEIYIPVSTYLPI